MSVDATAFAETIAELVVTKLNRPPAATASPWLDLRGAASYLAWSPERLRKLVQRPAVSLHQERCGGRIFFNRAELDEWMGAQ